MRSIGSGLCCVVLAGCFAATVLAQGNARATSSMTLPGNSVLVEYGKHSQAWSRASGLVILQTLDWKMKVLRSCVSVY
jgi:hypothetical protein